MAGTFCRECLFAKEEALEHIESHFFGALIAGGSKNLRAMVEWSDRLIREYRWVQKEKSI